MDNLQPHKVAGVAESIQAAGATLRYLPASSTDLNPIENDYSKLKGSLRKGNARSVDAHTKLVGWSITAFTKQDFRGYFSHAGYRN
jgi:transposase